MSSAVGFPLNVFSFLLRIKSVSGRIPFWWFEQLMGLRNKKRRLLTGLQEPPVMGTADLSTLWLSLCYWVGKGSDSFFLWWKTLPENQVGLKTYVDEAFLSMALREPWACQLLAHRRWPLTEYIAAHDLEVMCKCKDLPGEHVQVQDPAWESAGLGRSHKWLGQKLGLPATWSLTEMNRSPNGIGGVWIRWARPQVRADRMLFCYSPGNLCILEER